MKSPTKSAVLFGALFLVILLATTTIPSAFFAFSAEIGPAQHREALSLVVINHVAALALATLGFWAVIRVTPVAKPLLAAVIGSLVALATVFVSHNVAPLIAALRSAGLPPAVSLPLLFLLVGMLAAGAAALSELIRTRSGGPPNPSLQRTPPG